MTSANIKSGVNIFGVSGSSNVVDTSSGDALAANLALGKKAFVDGILITGTAGSHGNVNLDSDPIPAGPGLVTSITLSLSTSDVCEGKSIFGAGGTALCNALFADHTASNAHRDPGSSLHPNLPDSEEPTSTQLILRQETFDYSGSDMPLAFGYSYRDVPKIIRDNDGYTGFSGGYAPRPTVDCGTSGNIEDRIADCSSQNMSRASWDGNQNGNSGQGSWTLVSRIGGNKEVWRDERTLLLWTSRLPLYTNWCKASGNAEMSPYHLLAAFNVGTSGPATIAANATTTAALTGNGTIGNFQNLSGNTALEETLRLTYNSGTGVFDVLSNLSSGVHCGGGSWSTTLGAAGSQITYTKTNVCSFTITQGSTPFVNNDRFIVINYGPNASCYPGGALQSSPATSVCAEEGGLVSAVAGENWTSGVYHDAKGQMGKNAVTSVRWRLPTRNDQYLAEINGIGWVLPDMGVPGYQRPTPDSSTGQLGTLPYWLSTVQSTTQNQAWIYYGNQGNAIPYPFSNSFSVRCVGR